MQMSQFRQAMIEAGFSMKQMEFLEEWVAEKVHGHTIEDVAGLLEALDEIEEDEGEEDDE
jgi:hypothetical protein